MDTKSQIINSYSLPNWKNYCKINTDYYVLFSRQKFTKEEAKADVTNKTNNTVFEYRWITIEDNFENMYDFIRKNGDINLTYLVYKYRNGEIVLRNLGANICKYRKPQRNYIWCYGDTTFVWEKIVYNDDKNGLLPISELLERNYRIKTLNQQTLQIPN